MYGMVNIIFKFSIFFSVLNPLNVILQLEINYWFLSRYPHYDYNEINNIIIKWISKTIDYARRYYLEWNILEFDIIF